MFMIESHHCWFVAHMHRHMGLLSLSTVIPSVSVGRLIFLNNTLPNIRTISWMLRRNPWRVVWPSGLCGGVGSNPTATIFNFSAAWASIWLWTKFPNPKYACDFLLCSTQWILTVVQGKSAHETCMFLLGKRLYINVANMRQTAKKMQVVWLSRMVGLSPPRPCLTPLSILKLTCLIGLYDIRHL